MVEHRVRDFTSQYHGMNPYRETSARHHARKALMLLLIAVVAIVTTACLLLFHPFFQIGSEHVILKGATRIPDTEILSAVQGFLSGRMYGFIPRNSFFTVNSREIDDVLTRRFSLSTSHTDVVFPHRLAITIQEKTTTCIYATSRGEYALIGRDGQVIEKLRPPMNADTNAPSSSSSISLILRTYGVDHLVMGNASVDSISTSTLAGILAWFEQTEIPIEYISLGTDANDATIKTARGFDVHVRPKNVSDQLALIEAVLLRQKKEKIALSYIDTRYAGRVYWK